MRLPTLVRHRPLAPAAVPAGPLTAGLPTVAPLAPAAPAAATTTTPAAAPAPSPLRRAPRRAVPVLAGLATTAVLVVAGAGAAAAHDEVRSTSPAAEASVDQAPAEVSLELSAPALAQGTVLAVLAPDGTDLVDGAPVLVDDTVTQPLVADRPAGTYTVQWRVTSADGHPISGTFTFEAATAAAAAPSATTAPSASPEPTASTGPDASTDPSASSGAGGTEEPAGTATSSEPEMTTMVSDPAGEEGDPPLSGTAGTVLAAAAALAALVGAGVAFVRMRRRS